MVAESTDRKTSARAFSYLVTANQCSVALSPLVGGLLYRGGGSDTNSFGRYLQSYPALLPAAANFLVLIGAFLMISLYTREVRYCQCVSAMTIADP